MNVVVLLLLAFLAIAGNARVGLFSLNRLVFGEKHESDRLKYGLLAIPVVLLLLSPLYYFFWRGLQSGSFDKLAIAGAVWLAISVMTGSYWIIDRIWQTTHPPKIYGVRKLESREHRIRKPHVPFAALRRLGAHNDLYDLEVTAHEVIIDDLPAEFDGYRIAFMTDTHVTGFMRRDFYRLCVDEINRLEVDLVLLGGDYVTWKEDIESMAEVLLDGLRARDGIFAVLGNHDYWADADAVVASMTAKGVEFIVNRSRRLIRGDAVIDLIGIDEAYRGQPDIEATFASVPGDRPCIGVSHHPDIIGWLEDRRIDLLVAGHTHGGQIRFPLLGAIVVPSKHEGLYAAGFHRQDDLLLYVSRGLGSVPPIRILCPPELATFTLRRDSRVEKDPNSLKDKPLRPERRDDA